MAEPSRMAFGLAVLLSPLTCHTRTPSTRRSAKSHRTTPASETAYRLPNTGASLDSVGYALHDRHIGPGKLPRDKERISHKKAPAARQSRSCHAGFLWLLEKVNCAGPGLRNAFTESFGRRVFSRAFRQHIWNSSEICSAYAPLPCIRVPKFGSFSLPPRISRIRFKNLLFLKRPVQRQPFFKKRRNPVRQPQRNISRSDCSGLRYRTNNGRHLMVG